MESLTTVVAELARGIELLSVGIDYRQYRRFMTITPHLVWWAKEDEYRPSGKLGEPTEAEAQFCLNFVIEAAIALQGASPIE